MKAVLIQTSQDTMHMQYMGNVPLILVSLTLVMVNSFPLMVLKVSMPNLMPEKQFRHGFLDGNFLFYRFPGFLRILVILSGSERKSYVSAGKVWICRYRPGTYSAVPLTQVKKRKTAAYARVSTDHEDQASSYEAQVDYYTNYIKSRDDWKFAGIYADEGISGCNTKSVTALTAWCRTRWTDASI